MTELTLQSEELSAQCLQLLEAYAMRARAAKATADDFDGWLERISTLPGLTSESLVRMHGQLIALGFLKFEITGRSVGLRYQISPRGRKAMESALAAVPRDDTSADPAGTYGEDSVNGSDAA